MTDIDALRRAILADPADDTVRLAYADALEEGGDRDRAEFVRVGVKVARMPSGCGVVLRQGCDGNKEWCLRCREVSRERELLRLHEATWRRGRRCGACGGEGRLMFADLSPPSVRDLLPDTAVSPDVRLPPFREGNCPACRRTGWLGSLAERCLTNNPRRVADIGGTVIYETTEWQDGWLIPAEWSRGFVSGVRVTLDQLTREWNGHPWAAALFREWPVTRVVVTDREPWSNHDRTHFGWWGKSITYARDDSNILPRVLMDEMNSDPRRYDHDIGIRHHVGSPGGACIMFRSPEYARDALEDAVCRWGREEAAKLDDQERQ